MRWSCNLSSVFSLTLLHSHTTNTCTINLRLRLSLRKKSVKLNAVNFMNIWVSAQCSMVKSSVLFECGPLTPTFTLCPHVNQLSSPRPSLFFAALPLPCLILHKLNGEGLATVYVGREMWGCCVAAYVFCEVARQQYLPFLHFPFFLPTVSGTIRQPLTAYLYPR